MQAPVQVSQRTLVRLMEVLTDHGQRPSDLDAPFDFYNWLYEHDFPDWFLTHALSYYSFEWREIIVAVRNGDFFFSSTSLAGSVSILGVHIDRREAIRSGAQLLERLAVLSTTLNGAEELKRSIEVDGFEPDIKTLRLRPLSGPVSVGGEQSRADALASNLDNPKIANTHSGDATKLFIAGDFHPSLNESRAFVQEIIDQISAATDKHVSHSFGLPGGTANRIEYLRKAGFLSSDEEAAFKAAWGMLSAGSHPGLPLQEEARIGLVLALELGQILLIKLAPWKANAYKHF
jgi:hypothetical protein